LRHVFDGISCARIRSAGIDAQGRIEALTALERNDASSKTAVRILSNVDMIEVLKACMIA
jgi:hypothetical protein